jgi:hypothetical protein
MRHIRPLPAIAVLAAAVALMTSAWASANKMSVSSRTFRQTYSSLELEGEIGTVRCPITLEGSFHSSTFGKVANATLGSVSRAALNEGACTGGTVQANTETLPWGEAYSGFEGTLPTFTSTIRVIIGRPIRLMIFGMFCYYQAAIGVPPEMNFSVTLRRMGGVVIGVRFDGAVSRVAGQSPLCPPVLRARSPTGTETVLGTTASVSLTLI